MVAVAVLAQNASRTSTLQLGHTELRESQSSTHVLKKHRKKKEEKKKHNKTTQKRGE